MTLTARCQILLQLLGELGHLFHVALDLQLTLLIAGDGQLSLHRVVPGLPEHF